MPIEVVPGQGGEGLVTIVSGRPKGLDTSSHDTDLETDRYPTLTNVDIRKGHVTRCDGAALHTASFITDDNESPLGVGQFRSSGGTDRFVWIQQDGDAVFWSGSATVDIGNEGITSGTTNWFSVVQIGDYLVFSNPTDGNWKYDGTNFLPLGAKIINSAEATTDWAVSGDAANVATSTTAAFGLTSITFDALLLDESGTLTYDPTTLNVNDGLLLAKDYTEDDRLAFWVRVSDASTIDTTLTLVRIETSSGNDFDIAASAWTDQDGTTITLADNTWHRVEIIISGGTEAGTYDHTSVDQVHWVFDTNGTGGTSVFIDQVYMQYKAADVMPGGRGWVGNTKGTDPMDVVVNSGLLGVGSGI